MLNRRHLRLKVLQTIYAMLQSDSDDLVKYEKTLLHSMQVMEDIYLLMMSAFVEIRQKEEEYIEVAKKKHLATPEERNPNLKFVQNQVLLHLASLQDLEDRMEQRKLFYLKNNDDAIFWLLQAIKESDLYQDYMQDKKQSWENDLAFVRKMFEEIIAPNNKLYELMEDNYMQWADDFPLVNSFILKQLKTWEKGRNAFQLSPLFKDLEDKDFALVLFRKVMLNYKTLQKEYENKTPNWDMERIALMDIILLNMAIAEFLYFYSIPIKVTINEYLEIAKEYSTPNSAIFINGVLDQLVKTEENKTRYRKVGRGLM